MGIEDKQWLDLGGGEEVLWWNHPHIVHYLPEMMSGLVLTVIGIFFLVHGVPMVNLSWYPILISLLGIAMMIYQLLRRGNHYYIVTTEKIIERRGILSESRDPIHFNRIANTKMNRSKVERLISLLPGSDLADITIETAGTSGSDLYLLDIPDANAVAQLIEDQMVSSETKPGAAGAYPDNAD